jgi:hypothetical protein
MMLFFRIGAIWSGGVRHPIFITQRCSKQGRGRLWRRIRSGDTRKGNPVGVVGRKKTPDTRGHIVSDVNREGRRDIARAGPTTLAGLGPGGTRGTARAREVSGPRGRVGLPGQKRGREVQSFFFFSIISKHFQMILNPNLNLNQTTPTKNSKATA